MEIDIDDGGNMYEEKEIEAKEEIIQDVEGRILDFFIGCFKVESFDDHDEKLFGQSFTKLKVYSVKIVERDQNKMNIISAQLSKIRNLVH